MEALLHRPDTFAVAKEQTPRTRLLDEMIYLRHNWQKEDLPRDWRFLDGTGFQVIPHVDMLYASFSEGDTPSERKEKTKKWLRQTEQDGLGFVIEYLAEGLTFPIYYQPIPEEGRVVCPLYGNKDIEDIVSEKERKGSIRHVMEHEIKPFALGQEDGLRVITSPAGWSGLTDREGNPIVFPDSQTYMFHKRGQEIVGFTIRTDFNLEEHRTFLKALSGIDIPENAPLEDYVYAVGKISSKDFPDLEIRDIVNLMRRSRDYVSNGQRKNAYKDRPWDEIYNDLRNSEALWQFDTVTRRYFDEHEAFVLENELTRTEREEALAVTILRTARHIRGEQLLQKSQKREEQRGALPRAGGISYGLVYQDVEELEGCAGGGGASDNPFRNVMRDLLRQSNPTRHLTQSITPRIGVSVLHMEDDMGKLEFDCPTCNKTNKRPYNGFRTECEHCGSEDVAC